MVTTQGSRAVRLDARIILVLQVFVHLCLRLQSRHFALPGILLILLSAFHQPRLVVHEVETHTGPSELLTYLIEEHIARSQSVGRPRQYDIERSLFSPPRRQPPFSPPPPTTPPTPPN